MDPVADPQDAAPQELAPEVARWAPGPLDVVPFTGADETVRRTRGAFLLRVRPERLEEYLEVHERVWPTLMDALRRNGWRNYTLFVRPTDGLLVGCFEADDVELAMQRQGAEEVDRVWQTTMAQYFADDAGAEVLTPYFHLA